MEFRVLGPLAVLDDAGRPLRVGGRRGERLVLGVLLLEAGTVVPVHRLVELLWADDPPAGARGIVSTHLSRLRRDLDPERSGTGVRLENHGDGYRIDVAPEQVDAHRFRRAVQEARDVPDAAGRSLLLSTALDLWRGPLLADAVTDEVRDRVGAGWEELRLGAAESLAEAQLELGRAGDVVPSITDLAEQHPFREGLVALLMTALARSGRVPDALAVYRRTQQRLRDELGLDPGPRLRELHAALLRGGPADGGGPQRAPVPSELPRAPRDFVGREPTLRRLDEVAGSVGTGGPNACLLIGPPGVGKTALALHWATGGRDRFPDGQLYVPLRGSGPAPLPPGAALAHLLRSLGVRPDQVPGDLAEASALYRSVLADRRVVVLLDDAADAAQVRPLLPGAGESLALVTSRQRLGGLVALDGALGVPVAPLAAAESALLLETMLGKQVAAEEATAVRQLADVCDHLPLALRIAAANLGDEPAPVAGYLQRLDEDRLGALRVEGDPAAAVRVALDASYARLGEPERRLLRLLALTGLDAGPAAAGALLDVPAGDARPLLARLDEAHLVEAGNGERWSMHDLVRLYAHERAAAEDSEAERAAASRRLVGWYLWLAFEVSRSVLPARTTHLVDPPEPRPAWTGGPAPGLPHLDAERHQVRDVAALAGRWDGPAAVWSLAYLLAGYFQVRGDGLDSLELYQAALAAAEGLGDDRRAVAMHNSLGIAHAVCGRRPDAVTHLDRSVALSRAHGEELAEAVSLYNLGRILVDEGEPDRARVALLRSLRLREAVGRTERNGHIFNGLGWLELRVGDHAAAEARLATALELHRAGGDVAGEGHTLDTIGQVHAARGETAAAAEHFLAALEALRSVGDVPGEVETLRNLGALELARGDPERATTWFADAVGTLRATGDLHQQALVHRELAEAYLALGDRATADEQLRAALELRRTVPDPAEERRIRELLGP